jgi:hypothetical protein
MSTIAPDNLERVADAALSLAGAGAVPVLAVG